MAERYVDPFLESLARQQAQSQPATSKNQNSGFFGDFVDAVQQGAYQSAAGDAEAVGQISYSDTFKSIGKALAKGANSQTDTMTVDAQQALSQHIFKDDPDSFTGVAFDDGATNWRTWALQFGVLGGQVAANLATGFGAGTVVKLGAKQVIKSVAKKAITKEAQQLVAKNAVKEAIRNGALDDVRAALIAAPDKAAMNAVLNKATSRLGGIATTAVAGSMAAGMRAQQARDEYLGLDADTLNQNPEFQKAYWEIADNPENQGLDTATIHNAAKEMLAEKAATTAFFDKKALLSDLASGAYVPGAGGVIGRGAATASKMGRFGIGLAKEGAPEAWQGGETQRAVNEAIKEWGDESRDPMANVVRTRWEEGTLGGVFGGMAKVVEGQHVAPSKPIVTVENPPSTGNSTLDSALAQSNADEQSRYDTLTGHVDELSKPAYMRNGDISPALESAITRFRIDEFNRQQAEQNNGVMQPFDNPVTGNPDEPAFLRSRNFNPTGRDLTGNEDVNPESPVQQALARSAGQDRSLESQLADTMANGDQGKTPQEDFVTGEWLRWDQRQPMSEPNRIESGVTMPGESREILPESRGLGYNNQINMGGQPGNGINDNYVPPVTANRVTADQSLDVESTRDPRSPVAQSIDNAGQQSDAIFNELKSLRVTRRGKPFGSVKEAQLASRKTETPIELPTGGFGVVDKAELELVQKQAELNKWNQARIEAGLAPFTNERPSEEDADLEVWGKALNEWANEEANQSINDISAIDGKNNQQNKDGIAVDQNEREDGKTELLSNGLRLFHGSSNADLTLDDIQIVRSNQKQGKKGRSYGGFYGSVEDDISNAERYANMSGNPGTMYEANIAPGTKVLHKVGDVTRLSERYIDELRSQGYGLVVGRDPTGRHTEYAVIDKSAISGFGKKGEVKSQSTAPVMNDGTKQPEASQVNHDSNEAPGSDVGNGFKTGPYKGEKYRVSTTNTTGDENGTPILEKRLPSGSAATFYVGKDGNLLDADNVIFNDESSKERVWRPASKEQTAEAASILDEMGKLELNNPKRAELKVKLKALVLGEATSTIKPSMQAEASQNQSITEISQEERNRAIENRASSYDRLANEQDELGDLGDKELAAKYRAKAEEIRQRKSTSQPNADQAAGTPSHETVTAPVVAKESQPQPASNAEPISEADLKDFDLLKEHAGKWKYRYAVGANWQTANSKESAIERATDAHHKATANGDQLPTKAERYATSEAEQTAQMEQRYGKMSIPELEKEHSRLGGVVSDLRQTGKNEFNGNGGRRTGAATANEGARDASLEKMRLEGYIQARKERESVTGNNENSQGINENSLANSPETTAIKPEKTIEDHFKDLSKYQSGEMDFDEFKQAASDFLDNEESVKAKLAMLTKPEILKRMGPMFNYNHKGDKKDVIVDAAYQSLAGQLRFAAQGDKDVITETVSFEEIQGKRARKTTASKAREEIAALTSEKYGIYQEKAKAATKKAEERFQKVKQQITDPQTLDDFETFLNYRSIDKLTPEQKARYEDLKAERNLDKRDQAAAAAKETKVVPTATGDIVKTKHTKEGHDLFVVKLADRVDRDAYTTINAKAKELGGYYSKFRGNGAVPGFQFRTEEQAKEFQQWLSNAGNKTPSVTDVKATTDITAEPEVTSDESSKKKQADKLRDRAASVREKAQAELNADRKSNTVKRAREAAYAVARAEADLRFANILDAIANGIEAGEIKYLRNMTAGTQLETLDTVLRRIVRSNKMSQAIRDDLIQKGYLRKGDDAELSWTDSAPIEVITQYAEMPGMDYWANILRDTAKNMQTTAGFKQAGVKIMNQVLMAINAENRMVTISDPDLIDKLKQFSKQHEVRDYLKDTMADYDRLVRMGITSPIELRAALRELHKVKQSLKGTQPKRDPVKQKEDALKMRLLNNRNAFVDFFPTPDEHANDVIARAGIEPGMRVLEPSAGHGALAVAARDAGATVDAVELSNDLRDILTEKGFNLVGSDFMATEPAGEYDAVVMNPPFSNDMDIDHVKHAYAHLKPGGRLVAIVSSMAGERSNNKNKQFKEWLDSLGATEEMMPEGSFKNSMNPTSVRTKIIELQKPADSGNVKPQPMGSRVTIHTPKGKPVEVQYQLVSAADLVASNEFDGRVNKSYPQELQPRDRTKASYQQQVNQIASNPEGSRLAGSPESDRGAPIVRDLVVESGNGRTIGIKQAYKQGTANEYRDYLIKHADEFGFTADDVNLIDDPVLVRQRVSELSPEERLDFVVDSNTDAKMANSAMEDAKSDARYLDNGMMDLLNIPEGGDLLAYSNERFLSSFATKLGVNSLNSYKDSAGRWNEAFRKRVSNAIFAYGYDNDTLLKAATGDTSEAGKNLTNALMNNAAKVAELRSMSPDTAKAFVNYLAEGIDVMTSAKRNGQSIQEVVNQGDMLSGGVSHYGGAIAEMLADASRSGKRLTEMLNQITGMLNESAKAADQIDLLTGEPTQQVTAEEAINAAEKDFNERKQQEQRVRPSQDLFGANSARIGDNNGSGTSVSRPVSASETKSAGENSRLNLVNGLLGGETEKAQFSKMPLNAAEKSGQGMTKPEAELAAKEWLKRFKTDVQVKVAKDQAEFDQLLTEAGQGGTLNADEIANAAYLPESKTLLLNASAIQNPARLRQLMRHEILGHHGLEYVIGKGAVNDILQILKNGYATSKAIRDAVDTVAANYADADVKTKIKEAFAHYAENRPVDKGALGRLWDRVVSAVKSALVKAGFIRVNEAEQQMDALLKTIAENMRHGRNDNGPNGWPGNKAYFSKGKNGDTSAYGQASSLLKESGSSLVNWLKQQRGRGLGTLTDLQIDQIYRDITGGAINRYQKLRTKMESDRNDILLEAETKYEPMWEAMPDKEKAALSQLMYDATMSRLHPDKPLEDNSLYKEAKDKLAKARTEKTKAEYQAELDIIRNNYRNLSERYRLSSKQSKELYGTMRDLYAKQWETLRKAIEQRIEDQLGEGGKALASQMRLRMEHALQHGPYFPLARFGNYVVKARKDGEYIREHFEKRKDAEAALKQYRGEGYNAVMTVKETSAGDQANAHALGMEVIEALDKAQAEGTAPAELKDTVWQAMLDMLPDSSYAKHAIHRKRIKGASRDGHRAYLQSVYHFAHHVSKIRYGHKMKAELDAMKDQVKLAERGEESSIKPDDIEVAQQVLNEMNKRHELNMNPKGSSLAGMAGNIGFLFYLGASPASAVINLTQNVTVMLPQLAGKYGFVKAAKFMLQAMVDYMRHGVFQKGTKEAWVSLTRATNAAITADEKAMLNKLYKAGVLDLTQAHSIAARADTDQQNIKPGKQWARTGMRWAGALFHNAEVLNREVAALTAYRLMKAQQPGIASDVLKGDSAAIDQVAEMVYDGHGNYAASNRPRYMRSDVMKVLTQFKIYSQMMTYTLARNAVLAAKGDKTALKTLGAMFGTTWMMAGMMGMPTPVGLILYGLASLFDDDDDRTGEASFRLGLTEVFGAEVGELIAKGPVDAISGLNISGRTGLSDLWWRSPKEGTEGDDLTFHYVQQIAGPVLGIGVSAVRGMREFANGDIQRGVEAMSPKAVKDLAKAYRQATEGEQTRNGDSVIDDVGAWNVAMQAMGFSSAKMSQVYAARGYIKGKEKVIEDERSNLLADFFDAKRSGDEEAMRDVMERIKAFNSKHDRAETITGRTLMQSIKSRNRSMERTQAGVYLSKKREYLRGEGAFLDDEDDDE